MNLPVASGLQELVSCDEEYSQRYEDVVRTAKTAKFTELKKSFQREFSSWQNRKHWSKKHGVEWDKDLEGFAAFLIVVGPIPHEGWTLDRIDPLGGYVPDNLRWASKTTQSRNRTSARAVVVQGVR